jgi:3-deoxy-D-manno-octulosonic-acid transferase
LQAERLRALGAAQVRFRGNLKFSAAPLPAGGIELESLRRDVDGRPLWLAASTHPGEDAMVFEAHRLMRRTMPNLLTVLVPRHPSRGNEITEEMAATELKVARRSLGETVEPDTEFYLGDTLGELGLFYRLTGIAFIGGSMAAHGGHNPLEAAQLDCAILHGPDMANFETIAAELSRRGGAIEVGDAATLADAVAAFLKAPERRMAAAKTAADVAHENADAVEKVFAEIEPFLVGGI